MPPPRHPIGLRKYNILLCLSIKSALVVTQYTCIVCHTPVSAESNPFKRTSIMGIVRMFDVQSVWFLALWSSEGHCNPLLLTVAGADGRMWTE